MIAFPEFRFVLCFPNMFRHFFHCFSLQVNPGLFAWRGPPIAPSGAGSWLVESASFPTPVRTEILKYRVRDKDTRYHIHCTMLLSLEGCRSGVRGNWILRRKLENTCNNNYRNWIKCHKRQPCVIILFSNSPVSSCSSREARGVLDSSKSFCSGCRLSLSFAARSGWSLLCRAFL